MQDMDIRGFGTDMMTDNQIRLWVRRKWWVDPFLYAMFAPTYIAALISEDHANRVIGWIGSTIGRHGFDIGAD